MAEAKTKPAESLIACKVLRDFWPSEKDEERVRKGTIIEVSAENAIDGIEAGALSRIK